MFKKILALILCTAVVVGASGCGQTASAQVTSSKSVDRKLNVSVSFNAMAEFAKAVGKDKVTVSTIIPDGTEPHDFEPKAQDLVGLSKADVFV